MSTNLSVMMEKPRHPIMEIFFNFFDKEEEKEEVEFEFEFVFERKLFKVR